MSQPVIFATLSGQPPIFANTLTLKHRIILQFFHKVTEVLSICTVSSCEFGDCTIQSIYQQIFHEACGEDYNLR